MARAAVAGVAREADAGAGKPAGIAEYHALHRNRRARVMAQAAHVAIGAGPGARPGSEHGRDRRLQLHAGVLRERRSRQPPIGLQMPAREFAQSGEIQLPFVLPLPHGIEVGLEGGGIHPCHDLAVARNEAAIGVPGQAGIAGRSDQPRQRRLAQPDVEESLHHSRHRHRRTGSYGQQERPARIAEAEPGCGLKPFQRVAPERRGHRFRMGAEAGAQHEGRRHVQLEPRQPGEVVGFEAHRVRRGCRIQRPAGSDRMDLHPRVGGRHRVHVRFSSWFAPTRVNTRPRIA